MSLPHIGALKLTTWAGSLVSAALFTFIAEAQDLSNNAVKLALIAACSSLLIAIVTGATSVILQVMNRSDAREMRIDTQKSLANQDAMKESMDGHFSKLLAKTAQQGNELVDKTDKLAHAEGRREGVEATEGKVPHEEKETKS
jgi:hypothetical protein